MPSRLNAYISFQNQARVALEFYHTIFGGKLDIKTFQDFQAAQDPAEADQVMHGMLEADNGISFMASDTPSAMPYDAGSRISLALSGDDEAELTGYFNRLSEGGTIGMPLNKAPWGDSFGMVVDKFGVTWMVNIAGKR